MLLQEYMKEGSNIGISKRKDPSDVYSEVTYIRLLEPGNQKIRFNMNIGDIGMSKSKGVL